MNKLVLGGVLAVVAVLAVAAMLPVGTQSVFASQHNTQNNHQHCDKAKCGQLNQNNQNGDNEVHGGGINF